MTLYLFYTWHEKKCVLHFTCTMLRMFPSIYTREDNWWISIKISLKLKQVMFRAILALGRCSSTDFSQLQGLVSCASFITRVDKLFHYVWFFGQLQEFRQPRSRKRAGRRRILHFPIPDYSSIPPKIDCWRRTSKTGGENNEVSCVVSCSVVQTQARNLPGIG
jgi:hypothetical protein